MSKFFHMDKAAVIIAAMDLDKENKKLKLELSESIRVAKALSAYARTQAMGS